MGRIKVNGTGRANAKPDYLRISITTETVASGAADVRSKHVARSSKVQAVIEGAGLTGKDVERSSFSYGENFVYNKDTHANERRGFKATSVTVIRYRDFDGVPGLLDALTEAGATGINGPNFAVDDEGKLADQARLLAYRDALRKAQALCAESGRTLLGVAEIEESEGHLWGGGKAGSNVRARDNGSDGESLLGEVEKSMTLECVFEIA